MQFIAYYHYINIYPHKGVFYLTEFFEVVLLLKLFLSILSKQVEHNKCPFLIQNVFVDLSISLRQIRHLKIGDILKINSFKRVINNVIQISYFVISKSWNLEIKPLKLHEKNRKK